MSFQHRILPFPPVTCAETLLEPGDALVLCGSCFSENIGGRLRRLYHPAVINPLGIAFDPVSLLTHFEGIDTALSDEWIFQRHGIYLSWNHHSHLYSDSAEGLLKKIKAGYEMFKRGISDSKAVVITLGTAYHYVLSAPQHPVANCHKMPSYLFEKKLLSVDNIIHALNRIIAAIRKINNRTSLIFTVSPVKHLRDGIIENTRSKAHLSAAVHVAVEMHENAFYFPSFEIITDVLRNYEYYDDDMAHPSAKAIDVVFDYFVNSWFSKEARSRMKFIDQFLKNLYHNVRIPEAGSAHVWIEYLKKEKSHLENVYHISLNEEDNARWNALVNVFGHH